MVPLRESMVQICQPRMVATLVYMIAFGGSAMAAGGEEVEDVVMIGVE